MAVEPKIAVRTTTRFTTTEGAEFSTEMHAVRREAEEHLRRIAVGPSALQNHVDIAKLLDNAEDVRTVIAWFIEHRDRLQVLERTGHVK